MSNTKAVQQYLTRYAEPEVALLRECLEDARAFDRKELDGKVLDNKELGAKLLLPCQFGLVIPCYNESSAFLSRFIAQFSLQSVCLVVVINQPDNIDNSVPQQALLDWIVQHTECVAEHEHLAFFRCNRLCLLVVKRFKGSLRIPAKQGVGLARKIGADMLAALSARGLVSCTFLGSTDADAWLPNDYFAVLQRLSDLKAADTKTANAKAVKKNNVVAGVFGFKHDLPEEESPHDEHNMAILQATALYEQWLNYYVAGLRFAGSKYSFHTIGSCLAFHVEAYCQVRGFPTRAGGEDFYLLNKLAKLSKNDGIASLPAQIILQARVSARVPFGTGPAVKKLLEDQATAQTFEVYCPRVFQQLADLLAAFNRLWPQRNSPNAWLAQLPESTQHALTELGWQRVIGNILAQCRSADQLLHQINGWFDGFRTLRFIHLLERLYFFPVSLHHARQTCGFSF